MALLEASAPVGLEANDVRPRAKVQQLAQLEQIAKDQAAVIRALSGQDVHPDVPGSDVAPPHVHDGTNGALIPIPFAQVYVGADLSPASSAGNEDFRAVIVPGFYAPPGVTSVRVKGYFSGYPPQAVGHIRVSVSDGAAALQYGPVAVSHDITGSGVDGLPSWSVTVPVTEDDENLIEIACWDSSSEISGNSTAILPERRLEVVTLSYDVEPSSVPAFGASVLQELDDVTLPTLTQFDGQMFTAFDSSLFTDAAGISRGVCSFIAAGIALNDAGIAESLTGQPAGANSAVALRGHRHRGGTAPTDWGATFAQHLASWSFGSARRPNSTATSIALDQSNATNNATGSTWKPAPLAPIGSYADIHRGFVRLPEAPISALDTSTGGATTKLKLRVVAAFDSAKATSADIRVTVYDKNGANPGTAKTVNTTTNGRHVVTVDNLDAFATATGNGDEAMVKIESRQNGGTTQETAILGAYMWLSA